MGYNAVEAIILASALGCIDKCKDDELEAPLVEPRRGFFLATPPMEIVLGQPVEGEMSRGEEPVGPEV